MKVPAAKLGTGGREGCGRSVSVGGGQGRPEGGSCRTGSGGRGRDSERAEGTFLTPDEARRSWAFHRPSCWSWRAGPGVWGYSSAWSARDVLSRQLAMG